MCVYDALARYNSLLLYFVRLQSAPLMSTKSAREENCDAASKNMDAQTSQLFQVLYLGSTGVDRHCSIAVMPWITEELKLKTEQRILTWLTAGESGIGGGREREGEGGMEGEGARGRDGGGGREGEGRSRWRGNVERG